MDKPVEKIAALALVVLATARATRFVTSDHLGEWWLVGPAKRWAWRDIHESKRPIAATMLDLETPVPTPPAITWRTKLVAGLDCPFCVGFWIGALILLGEATLSRSRLGPLWRLGLGALGLNYVVGHLSSRLDS